MNLLLLQLQKKLGQIQNTLKKKQNYLHLWGLASKKKKKKKN